MEGFWGILGVAIGFALGELSRLFREKSRINELKNLLVAELRVLRFQMPQKRDILRKMLNALTEKSILGGSSVRFLNVGYKNYFSKVYEHLTHKQRNCLHVIHERLRGLDGFLSTFEEEFRLAVKDPALDDPFAAYSGRIQDYLESVQVVENLIDSYLSNEPIDVFYIEQQVDSNAHFK